MPVPNFASGLLLKVAMGATTVTAAVAGAGAVGALPGPAQSAFAASVEAVTPFQVTAGDDTTEQVVDDEITTLPDEDETTDGTVPDETDDETEDGTVDDGTTDETDDAVDDGTTDDETDDAVDPGAEGTTTYDPELYPNFGAWVSEQARQGGVDGREISAAAHAKNEARKAERAGDDADDTDDGDAAARANGRGGAAKKGPKKNR